MRRKSLMSSNASIFADRGDPWVTDREGREKFGRNIASENPGVDAYLFADKAKKKDGERIIIRRETEKPDDVRRRLTGMVLKAKRKIALPREEKITAEEASARLKGFKHD